MLHTGAWLAVERLAVLFHLVRVGRGSSNLGVRRLALPTALAPAAGTSRVGTDSCSLNESRKDISLRNNDNEIDENEQLLDTQSLWGVLPTCHLCIVIYLVYSGDCERRAASGIPGIPWTAGRRRDGSPARGAASSTARQSHPHRVWGPTTRGLDSCIESSGKNHREIYATFFGCENYSVYKSQPFLKIEKCQIPKCSFIR